MGRASGVLLHPTSLPGPGIGSLGDVAHRFVDWLADAGQSVWQILPLVAVDRGGSPYNGLSAMAGNALLVDPAALADDGLLDGESRKGPGGDPEELDFASAGRWKAALLDRAHRAFRTGAAPGLEVEFARYVQRHAEWLEDYALFRALRAERQGSIWTRWEPELRDRVPEALEEARRRLAEEVDRHRFQQFLFDRQWTALKDHARRRGVRILGDLPIFVAHDSADVWAHPDLFHLDEQGRPRVVSGVPPDYFSETGQRWGNPLYRWDVLRERGYPWWTRRVARTLEWVDLVRVDHFRGFEAYWEIPADEETAVHGRWRPGPGAEFFRSLETRLGALPLVSEDLGLITEEVDALRDELGYPGMRVLQFGFDGDADNPHLPENYPAHAVAYTGTHDNDTVLGWWRSASAEQREQLEVRITDRPEPLHWALIRLVWESAAELAIAPVQDVLGLGSDARMNSPGTTEENWSWRLTELPSWDVGRTLREITAASGRLPAASQPTARASKESHP